MTAKNCWIAETYWNVFREDVHHLLALGYQRAQAKLGENDREDDITGDIVEGIDAFLDEADERFDRYSVHGFKRQPNRESRGKKRPELDIVVQDGNKRPRIWYGIEAKRLKTNGHPISAYLGNEGMGCFINEKYVPESPEAIMLGYMQNKDNFYWFKQLEKCIKSKLSPCSINYLLRNEWRSTHNRRNGSKMTIFHIFLDCGNL